MTRAMRFFESLRRNARSLLVRQTMPPPDPDEQATPIFGGETVVEVRYSGQKNYRSVITQDSAGRFRVHRQLWDASNWDVAPSAYWADDDHGAVIADTLDRARMLATEALLVRGDA